MTHTTRNEEITKYQKSCLQELVAANEAFKGHRVIIDYAILLGCNGDPYMRENMEDYVQNLYKEYDR